MRVAVRDEIRQRELDGLDNWKGWELCFQHCRYVYDNGEIEEGFRFIWRRPNGSLQPARGQARLPSVGEAQRFIERATSLGWNGEGKG